MNHHIFLASLRWKGSFLKKVWLRDNSENEKAPLADADLTKSTLHGFVFLRALTFSTLVSLNGLLNAAVCIRQISYMFSPLPFLNRSQISQQWHHYILKNKRSFGVSNVTLIHGNLTVEQFDVYWFTNHEYIVYTWMQWKCLLYLFCAVSHNFIKNGWKQITLN